jgi:regulator of ribosome biosynthesis
MSSNQDPTNPSFNKSLDIGNLTVISTINIPNSITEEEIIDVTKQNLSHLFGELYKIKVNQIGKDDENRDYDKPINVITLPEGSTLLPRSLPIPKRDDNMTKWEKFAKEKGIEKRKKGRMIWSDEFQKYLPRWGKGSLKKETENSKYIIEDKEKYEGKNPFTYNKQEKKLEKLKQMKREKKNEDVYLKKKREKDSKLKGDVKSQKKNLEIVQKSSASQGRFEKKVKNEAPLDMIKKKKVSHSVMVNKKDEKERDSKIMNRILKISK